MEMAGYLFCCGQESKPALLPHSGLKHGEPSVGVGFGHDVTEAGWKKTGWESEAGAGLPRESQPLQGAAGGLSLGRLLRAALALGNRLTVPQDFETP